MEGLPNRYDHYRQRVCDYIERNEEEYAPFVEDDRTLAQVRTFRRLTCHFPDSRRCSFILAFQSP